MFSKKHIPNTITLLNLFLGCLAVVAALQGRLAESAMLILACSLLDFLDGFAARVFRAGSPLGQQLDSLADLVSFGLAPAAIVYHYMLTAIGADGAIGAIGADGAIGAIGADGAIGAIGADGAIGAIGADGAIGAGGATGGFLRHLPLLAFLLAVFSALRLGMFNLDTRQRDDFIGLPTPANALFFVSLPLVLAFGPESGAITGLIERLTGDVWAMLLLTLLFSWLLVSPIRMFSMKFKGFRPGENLARFLFLGGSLLLAMLFWLQAPPLIMVFYLILSLIFHFHTHTSTQ